MDNNTDNMIGRRLDGRYELLELIGTGGMADIYKAKDITEDRIVAVKILKNEFAGSEDFLRRFRNESKAIALLSHPNIVKIYDVGFNEQIQFIVMEYIDGISLAEYIKLQGVSEMEGCRIFHYPDFKSITARTRQRNCPQGYKVAECNDAPRRHDKGHGFRHCPF